VGTTLRPSHDEGAAEQLDPVLRSEAALLGDSVTPLFAPTSPVLVADLIP
jgi:hypothetical protein